MARKVKLERNSSANAIRKVFANGKIQITRKSMAPPTVHIFVKTLLVPIMILGLMKMGPVRQGQMTQQNQGW